MKRSLKCVLAALLISISVIGFSVLMRHKEDSELPLITERGEVIPADAVKVTPETDVFPPVVHSDGWDEPVPLAGPVNTAGAEDAPVITLEGDALFFFFTPDVDVPASKQIVDGVTGIWRSKKSDGEWAEPERIVLSDDVALDGPLFVRGDGLWFASVRSGNYREVDVYTARYNGEVWTDWSNAGQLLNEQYDVGELAISSDGGTMYFGREGEFGGRDLWRSEKIGGVWSEPVNLGSKVNSGLNEDQPFITPDGVELWFTGQSRLGYPGPAVFLSVKTAEGDWAEPEEIISNFAGDVTLDSEGNIYFAHHFFSRDMEMIEADIYVAYRRSVQFIEPADSPQVPSRVFFMGFLPIPADGQTFDQVYQQASRSIEFAPVWGRPTPFYELAKELSGSWGETFVEELTRENGMFPLVHVSFIGTDWTLASPEGMEGATLSDPEWREAYEEAVLDVVRAVKPLYLSVGNEVNRWYEKYGANSSSPNGFQHFVSLYEEIYDAVKELSPETKVFCTLAREIVAELREADLEVLRMFNPDKIDVLVFTSYPHAVKGINSPKDIPDDYYKRASDYFPDKPFGFSELGWPSLEAFGGEQGQADFIVDVSGRLTVEQRIDLHLLGWAWLHDIDQNDHVGLKKRDGTEKMAYEAWENISNSQ